MATLLERADIAQDQTFIRRVRQSAVNAAIDIAAEAPETANHEARRTLAARVTANPYGWSEIMAVGIAQNPNVGSGSSDPSVDSTDGDSAMQYVMNSLWDAYTEIPLVV